eukprot:NODE_464_length_7114_cov_0.303350.p5 type:complete len:152 gc:universal NODE_464_length_7114_cov_0.303350:763-1218(+)
MRIKVLCVASLCLQLYDKISCTKTPSLRHACPPDIVTKTKDVPHLAKILTTECKDRGAILYTETCKGDLHKIYLSGSDSSPKLEFSTLRELSLIILEVLENLASKGLHHMNLSPSNIIACENSFKVKGILVEGILGWEIPIFILFIRLPKI